MTLSWPNGSPSGISLITAGSAFIEVACLATVTVVVAEVLADHDGAPE